MIHVICRDVIVYGYSCLFFPSSCRVVINDRFFYHSIELGFKIIWSYPVHGICFVLFRHVVSSLMVISVSVSRCQLRVKWFNHLSIVGICLTTLFCPLSRCFVALAIVSRFNSRHLVIWSWNQFRDCLSITIYGCIRLDL